MWCPKCKTDRAHRSRRKGVQEHVASLFGYYPYRCRNCHQRFPRGRNQTGAAASRHPSTEREIRAGRRARDWQRKKRYLAVYGLALLLVLAFLYLMMGTRNGLREDQSALTPTAGWRAG